jgi:hypothetical protein
MANERTRDLITRSCNWSRNSARRDAVALPDPLGDRAGKKRQRESHFGRAKIAQSTGEVVGLKDQVATASDGTERCQRRRIYLPERLANDRAVLLLLVPMDGEGV